MADEMSFEVLRVPRASPAVTPLLGSFATEIYCEAFHEAHREPPQEWMKWLSNPTGVPAQSATLVPCRGGGCGCADGGISAGIGPADLYRDSRVLPRKGLGSVLFRDVREQTQGLPLFAEIADPSRAGADEAYARFRASMFGRWGWRAVGCAYLQPPLSAGGGWVSDLLLLHHGSDRSVPGAAVCALNDGLRGSLSSGSPPAGLPHRYPPCSGAEPILTLSLGSLG